MSRLPKQTAAVIVGISASNQPWREQGVNRAAIKFNPIYQIGILMQMPILFLNRGAGLICSRLVCVDGTRRGKMSTNSIRVAVDVGGTFTDICIFDDRSGKMRVEKLPSSADPIDAVLQGVGKAGIDLHDVALFSHGTTVATNALITRRLPRAAMVTSRGFRDIIEIRRGTKEDLWDAYKDVAPPYVRRRDRIEVTERVDYAGKILTDLDEEDARRVAGVLRRKGIETIAVCFINAHANPANERRMCEILEKKSLARGCPARARCCPRSLSMSDFPPRWPMRSWRRWSVATSTGWAIV